MDPVLRSSAAHVFVVDPEAPSLSDDDRHHLERVLRLRPGQVVTVTDGAGAWRPCAWQGRGLLEPTGAVVREPQPLPRVTVGFSLTKGERAEWAVQRLTEAGVDRLVPILAERSVVRWDEVTAGRRPRRWRRVLTEAAKQSRRVWLPVLDTAVPLGEAVAVVGPKVALAEPGGPPPSLSRPGVLVGPEGGWTPQELAQAPATVSLGPTILRAETAALAAGILLCSLRAGLSGG